MKFSIVLSIFVTRIAYSLCQSTGDFSAVNLRSEYLRNPLSVETPEPRLSWTFKENDPTKQNLSQTAYQILVATDEQKLSDNAADLWDSGKVISSSNTHIRYKGKGLASEQTAYWKVKVWDQNDKPSNYSSVAFWGRGLPQQEWTAQWIAAPTGTQQKALVNLSDADAEVITPRAGLVPVVYFRKPFTVEADVKSAKLYATAQGVYQVLLNGNEFQGEHLSPGWTDYNKTIEYQTYNVTRLVQKGDNVLTALLGTGWFSGYIGYDRLSRYYGSEQALLAELHIEYQNGTKVVVASDNSWRVSTGPILYSDTLHGELYYQERELIGYHIPTYDDQNWLSAVTKPIDKNVELVAQVAQPVRVNEILKPKSKWQSEPNVWVFDFEQNFVGWVEIKFKNNSKPESVRVQVRHAEVINPNGSVYVLNLRTALAIDTYVISNVSTLKNSAVEPHFTFHGFRYIEISGYPGEPELEDITGKVVHSDIEFIGHIETSNKMVNRVHLNTVWGQKGNFFAVPTDCPQRDERLGWSADAQTFAQTAIYNADVSAFYTKWFRDVREGQSAEGAYSAVSPKVVSQWDGAPAWGDAGVILPYVFYRMYGDLQVIEENFKAMSRWIEDYIWSANPDYIWTERVNRNYGDWLNVDDDTRRDLLATAFFANDALLLSRMATAINRTEDSRKYQELHANISQAFNKAFVNQTTGHIANNTQTGFLLALAFELLPEELRPLAANHLVENVKAHDWHLTTGFIGSGYLLPILTQYGYSDVAYRLILQDTYPSWGYCVLNNATTIWERWDGVKDGQFQDPKMNSFNHYSFGSVGRWMYQSMAGIDQSDDSTAFKQIVIRPKPGNGISFVDASYESINGLITSSWNQTGDTFKLKTSIPINTKATIDLTFNENGGVYEVGSGVYEFSVQLK